jgi:hypothetical protein
MDYQVYFDFRQASIDWLRLWPGFVLIICTAACLPSAKQRGRLPFGLIVLFSQVLILLAFAFSLYDQYQYYVDKFQQPGCSVIEGIVTNHMPVTHGDGGPESFEVNGLRFAYSGKDVPPPFHQTVAQGGQIRNGLAVRICYTDRFGAVPGWAILRIEVKKP